MEADREADRQVCRQAGREADMEGRREAGRKAKKRQAGRQKEGLLKQTWKCFPKIIAREHYLVSISHLTDKENKK